MKTHGSRISVSLKSEYVADDKGLLRRRRRTEAAWVTEIGGELPDFVSMFPLGRGRGAQTDDFRALLERHYPAPADRYKLLARLGMRMLDWDLPSSGAVGSASPLTVPAGYTYLGQFIAHDMSFTTEERPTLAAFAGRVGASDSLRETQLKLETIYAGGPRVFLPGYARPQTSRRPKRESGDCTHLRLSTVSAPGNPSATLGYDLPRAICPNANDGKPAPGLPVPTVTDALIGDQRNDDHAIISQLTVLFHRLHNKIAGALVSDAETKATAGLNNQTVDYDRLFERARDATTHIYRGIVWNDYLRRMLDPAVFNRYAPDPARPDKRVSFLSRHRLGRVPVEFSHAAFRFGHAMIRGDYQLNARLRVETQELLRHSAAKNPELMPISHDWLVDWRRFFDALGAGVGDGNELLVRSLRLRPSVVELLDPLPIAFERENGAPETFCVKVGANSCFADTISTRDMIRGASVPMATVDFLIGRMMLDPELAAACAHPLLASGTERSRLLGDWLKAGRVGFSESDIVFLSTHPPLLLFVLFEAERVGGGVRLGPLGSFIVAETIFAVLSTPVAVTETSRSRRSGLTASYRDLVAGNQQLNADLARVFGADLPASMSEMIASLDLPS